MLGELHKEELLLKSLITYFIVWSTNSKMTFFFLWEVKETLSSCLLKNTLIRHTITVSSEDRSPRVEHQFYTLSQTTEKRPSRARVTGRTFSDFQVQFYQRLSVGGSKHICFAKWKIAITICCREQKWTLFSQRSVNVSVVFRDDYHSMNGYLLYVVKAYFKIIWQWKCAVWWNYVDNGYKYEHQIPIKQHHTNSILRMTCHAKLTFRSTWIVALSVRDGFR